MATMIVRAFGAEKEGDISAFRDVKSTDWYAKSIAKAYRMGVMQGYAGLMEPESNITREQAFTMLARALKLEPAARCITTFEDAGELSEWARGEVYALVNAGYIQGSGGRLNPKSNISRAEFAQVMYNLIQVYITKAGEYTQVASGKRDGKRTGVTLKDLIISGDLIVGDGVGEGDLTLDNVIVKGAMIVRGGGVNSVIIRGGGVNGNVIITKVDGEIRVRVEGGAEVEVIIVDDGKDDVIIEGTVGTVQINTPDVPVVVRDATVDKIEITADGAANLTVAGGGNVASIEVGDRARGTAIFVEGKVNGIETSAPDTAIYGTGTVDSVTAKAGANNTAVTIPNTVVNNEGLPA
jgi:hypothetical protein